MADPEFWCRIEEKFRRLQALPPQPGEVHQDSHNGLCAHWRGEKNLEGLPAWYFSNAGGGTKKLFRRAAERAAVELGHHGGPTALFFWLDLLRLDGLFYKPQGDRGYIYQVCNASAEYCLKCETDAKAAAANAARLDRPPSDPTPSAPLQYLEAFGPIDEVIRAIQQAEQADPELRRKREKGDADYERMLRRYRGRNHTEADHQEELLRDCKRCAGSRLEAAVSSLPLHFPASESDIEAAWHKARKELVSQQWDEFLQQYRIPSDCKLGFREFEEALWNEGFPSLGEEVMAAIRKRAAESMSGIASDAVAGTHQGSAGNAKARSPLSARHKIEKFANDAFAVARDRIQKEHAAKKNQVLAQVRHNRGGYLPALTGWGAECVRDMIVALADAYVEAFTLHRAPSDLRAETTLKTESQKMAGGTISGIRGDLQLRAVRLRMVEEGRGIPWHLEIERAASAALKEGMLRLQRQRIKPAQEPAPKDAAGAKRPRKLESARLSATPGRFGVRLKNLKKESTLPWRTIAKESGVSYRWLLDLARGCTPSHQTREKLRIFFSRILQRSVRI